MNFILKGKRRQQPSYYANKSCARHFPLSRKVLVLGLISTGSRAGGAGSVLGPPVSPAISPGDSHWLGVPLQSPRWVLMGLPGCLGQIMWGGGGEYRRVRCLPVPHQGLGGCWQQRPWLCLCDRDTPKRVSTWKGQKSHPSHPLVGRAKSSP